MCKHAADGCMLSVIQTQRKKKMPGWWRKKKSAGLSKSGVSQWLKLTCRPTERFSWEYKLVTKKRKALLHWWRENWKPLRLVTRKHEDAPLHSGRNGGRKQEERADWMMEMEWEERACVCVRKLMWMCWKGVKGRLGSFGLFSLAHLPGEAATEQEGLKVNYISCPSQNKCQPPDGRCNTSSPLACLSAGTSPALDIRTPMTWIKIYAKHLRASRFACAYVRQIGRTYFLDYSWRPFVEWKHWVKPILWTSTFPSTLCVFVHLCANFPVSEPFHHASLPPLGYVH